MFCTLLLCSYTAPSLTGEQYDDVGFEAYGTFEEEVNPIVPFGRTAPTYLIPINEIQIPLQY